MQAIGLDQFGDPDVLHVVQLPVPEPGPGEVRIRVRAAGVNPTDLTFRSGGRAAQLAAYAPPYIPGMDAAGVIDAVGEGANRLQPGQAVVAFVVPLGPRGGAYAEQIVVPEASVVPAPAGATFPEAATLLLNAATARLSLDTLALPSESPVVVVGAAGAVGGYAVQLAKADGLEVIAVARRADADLVRSFGADEVVEAGGGLVDRLRNRFPAGAPGVIDGAALDAAILPAVADGGGLVSLKGWSGPGERGVTVRPISSFASATDTALFDGVARLAEAGVLALRVAGVVPPREAPSAHRRLAAGGLRGRLILDFSNSAS